MSQNIKSIKENNLIFVSAQPDEVYFHWQVEMYLYQFSQVGILDQTYALFGHKGDKPSDYAMGLAKKFNGRVFFYKDERTSDRLNYAPSIRPHILKKFFKEFPDLGKNVFYHDSDIFIVKVPPFELMLKDNEENVGHLSDTISYIGAHYIVECSERYRKVYPEIPEEDLFKKMCAAVEIDTELVRSNQDNSGGAQYVLKNIGEKFWVEVEEHCFKLWRVLKDYEQKYPISDHIQSWTTDMWAVLWTYWKSGKKTVVDKNLAFSWGVSTVNEYHKNNIFHLAGVTSGMKNKHFYKGEYSGKNVLAEYRKNNDLFNGVSKDSATYEYINVIKKYVDTVLDKREFATAERFHLNTKEPWGDVYRKVPKMFGGKNMWRSANDKFIIFYSGSAWVLTAKIYEAEITAESGGFASNVSSEPYENTWNMNCEIKIL